MTQWVLLLRGINVGGHGKLPMAALKSILTDLGARDVATYIQSGNVVLSGDFDRGDFLQRMWDRIESEHGFRREALLLTQDAFRTIAQAFPFDQTTPKAGHIWFHTAPPTPDTAQIEALKAPSERIKVTADATHLYAPDGIGKSKLAARLERALGVAATARNLNTVQNLLQLCGKTFLLSYRPKGA